MSTTGQEIYHAMKNIAVNQGKVMKVAAWSAAYRYAWNQNLIKRMNEQQRTEYKASVIEALKSEQKGQIRGSSQTLKEILDSPESIQSECHKRIMQAHFQEMINEKNSSK